MPAIFLILGIFSCIGYKFYFLLFSNLTRIVMIEYIFIIGVISFVALCGYSIISDESSMKSLPVKKKPKKLKPIKLKENYFPYEVTTRGILTLKNFEKEYKDSTHVYDYFKRIDMLWIDYGKYINSSDRFQDLRIALCELRGINPKDIIFLDILNENKFKDGWKFYLGSGQIWSDIDSILKNSPHFPKNIDKETMDKILNKACENFGIKRKKRKRYDYLDNKVKKKPTSPDEWLRLNENYFDQRVLHFPWKHLIPEYPSLKLFTESWKLVIGLDPDSCTVTYKNNERSSPALQWNPGCSHGGFGYFVEYPVLNKIDDGIESSDNFFNEWAPGWGIDLNYNRYRYIDKKTGLPKRFEQVKAIETIQNFFKNLHLNVGYLPSRNLREEFKPVFDELMSSEDSEYIKWLKIKDKLKIQKKYHNVYLGSACSVGKQSSTNYATLQSISYICKDEIVDEEII